MRTIATIGSALVGLLYAAAALAGEHPGKAQIEKDGYKGP